MVIFIDESGTHKQSGHAVNVIVYITLDNIEKAESQLSQIVADMGLESFHWAEHGWKVREKFLKKVIRLEFKDEELPVVSATELPLGLYLGV